MLNPETDIEWIDGFLQGQLSTLKIITFQQRLKNDTSFATLFEGQKVLADGIRLARMAEQVRYFQSLNVLAAEDVIVDETMIGEAVRLEKNLAVLERFRKKNEAVEIGKAVKISKRKNWQLIAASIIFLLGLSWYFLLFESKNEYQLLAEKYNEPYPAFGITKGNNENLQKIQTKGLLFYTEKKYQKAIPFLKKSLLSDKYNENYLYLSICYLETNQLDSAYTYLQNTPIFLPVLTDAAKWYLAIFYLKKEEISNCLSVLTTLAQSDALEFRRKADALKKDLIILDNKK